MNIICYHYDILIELAHILMDILSHNALIRQQHQKMSNGRGYGNGFREIIVEAGIINLIKIITLRCQQQGAEVETNDFYEH